MPYAASAPFHGKSERALQLAESALTALGFRLTARTPASLEMVGPGMNSTRQSELVGASRIDIRNSGSELSLEADLGGVERMTRFVTMFPLILVLGQGIVLAAVFAATMGNGPWIMAVVAVTSSLSLLWIVLGPWMARRIRARTCRGLDTLLANMVAVGKAS